MEALRGLDDLMAFTAPAQERIGELWEDLGEMVGIAPLLAFIGGLCLAVLVVRALGKHSGTAAFLKTQEGDREMWQIRHGIRPFLPLARRLLRMRRIDGWCQRAVSLLSDAGVASSAEAVLSCIIGLGMAAMLIGAVLSASLVAGIAVACALLIAVSFLVKSRNERRTNEMREEIPDALRVMSMCFRSGLSLQQTLEQTARETKRPLCELFEKAVRRLQTGETVTEALAVFDSPQATNELSFVAVALDAQHISGGSIAAVLDSARGFVEGELSLLRTLHVQTAQAKLSAQIVTIMPFALIAIFSLVSENFLAPFFESPLGIALFCVAIALQVAGILSVRRLLKVEVD